MRLTKMFANFNLISARDEVFIFKSPPDGPGGVFVFGF